LPLLIKRLYEETLPAKGRQRISQLSTINGNDNHAEWKCYNITIRNAKPNSKTTKPQLKRAEAWLFAA
jgi:hypothetical protein